MATTVGYDDTPFLPGDQYRVHDDARPQPRVVTPGTGSSQEKPGSAPSDADVLFDGSSLDKWENVNGGAAAWKVKDGYMEVVPESGNIATKAAFGDCQLHVEWAAPSEVTGDGQGRGNSGVFLMGIYEIQVLDCYDNPTYADGTAGAIYGQCPPLVNACRKPGEWQEYDIIWIAPRFSGNTLVSLPRVTVLVNGVVVQHAKEIIGPTTHKKLPSDVPNQEKGPLVLQDHKDRVRFRNIWCRELTDYDQG